MMYEREKSDTAVVAVKPTNKVGATAVEPVEPRAGTERNASEQSTHRTQGRARVIQALDRVRQAARQRKKEKFTALLHGGQTRSGGSSPTFAAVTRSLCRRVSISRLNSNKAIVAWTSTEFAANPLPR